MDFNTFKQVVKEMVVDYFPEKYRNANVEVSTVHKLNESYEGLCIQKQDSNIQIRLNLNQMYEKYRNGEHLQDLLEDIRDVLENEDREFDLNRLADYDYAKEHLFVKISKIEGREDVLKDVPFEKKEDLALTYHILVEQEAGGISSVMITNSIMKIYGIDQEQLHKDAIENSPKILPAKVMSVGSMLLNSLEKDGEDVDVNIRSALEGESSSMLTIVTNEVGIEGAATLFYPELMEKLSDQFGDYFILPSSIHETLILPDDGFMSVTMLKNMVTEINETQVMENERLTNEVYHYDSKEHVFERADKFKARKMAKSNMRAFEENTQKSKKTHEISL